MISTPRWTGSTNGKRRWCDGDILAVQQVGTSRPRPHSAILPQVKAVAQQTPGVNLAVGFCRGLARGVQRQPPGFSVEEDRRATVVAVQQMINRSRIWHWQLARHAPTEMKSCNMSIPLNDRFTRCRACGQKQGASSSRASSAGTPRAAFAGTLPCRQCAAPPFPHMRNIIGFVLASSGQKLTTGIAEKDSAQHNLENQN
jgi:hypothetical protein